MASPIDHFSKAPNALIAHKLISDRCGKHDFALWFKYLAVGLTSHQGGPVLHPSTVQNVIASCYAEHVKLTDGIPLKLQEALDDGKTIADDVWKETRAMLHPKSLLLFTNLLQDLQNLVLKHQGYPLNNREGQKSFNAYNAEVAALLRKNSGKRVVTAFLTLAAQTFCKKAESVFLFAGEDPESYKTTTQLSFATLCEKFGCRALGFGASGGPQEWCSGLCNADDSDSETESESESESGGAAAAAAATSTMSKKSRGEQPMSKYFAKQPVSKKRNAVSDSENEDEDEVLYKIDGIEDDTTDDTGRWLLVKWEGYPDPTWEPRDDIIATAKETVEKYERAAKRRKK